MAVKIGRKAPMIFLGIGAVIAGFILLAQKVKAAPSYPYEVGTTLCVYPPNWLVKVVSRSWDATVEDWVFIVENPDGSVTEWDGWILKHQVATYFGQCEQLQVGATISEE